MNLENLLETLPSYAKDLKLNAKSVILNNDILAPKQVAIIAISCAIATKNSSLIAAINNQFKETLNEVEINAAKAAAAIMGMNNVYYRFTHLAQNQEYAKMAVGLRMNIIASHGIDKIDFELASTAVSAINGCGLCIDSHEKTLKQHNVNSAQIQAAVKIAAIVNGLAFA